MTNMSITQDRLTTLTQRIKDLQISKADLENKFRIDRDLSFEFRSKSIRQRSRRSDTTSSRANQTVNTINKYRNNEMIKLFLKKTDE